jgi:hypothetical protein
MTFAHADRARGDLDQFVVLDELQRLLQGKPDRRCEQDVLVRAGARMLVSCLALSGLTVRSLSRAWMPTT